MLKQNVGDVIPAGQNGWFLSARKMKGTFTLATFRSILLHFVPVLLYDHRHRSLQTIMDGATRIKPVILYTHAHTHKHTHTIWVKSVA